MPNPKHFNTAGPCDAAKHYMLPAAERLPEARGLIAQDGYFVVHAPRQTGKTTTLRALAKALLAEGAYAVVHFTCESAEAMQEDVGAAEAVLLGSLRSAARADLPPGLQPPPWPAAPAGQQIHDGLAAWARACPQPLVLFFDEIDALRGESMRSVLRQLRAGFPQRPRGYPASVVLCGLRDVRDYRIASGGDPQRLGTSSPFNVKLKSLRVGDFSDGELRALYAQHTAATGQPFTDAALVRAYELTRGQPWLTNALAREIVEEIQVPPPTPIDVAHVEEAKERLILARQTHLDSLVARLSEPRVRRTLAPILEGSFSGEGDAYDDDAEYLRDLGLLAPGRPPRIANPMYREVIFRALANRMEDQVTADPRSFVLPDGRLAFRKLLDEFVAFWRRHGEMMQPRMVYMEVAPHLILLAFLHRIVNGGGYIECEVGIGRGRIDVHVRWPYTGRDGKRAWQEEAIELKAWGPKQGDPLAEGLEQLEEYLARLGLSEGTLVIFDRRPEAASFLERTRFEEARTAQGRRVTVLRA